MKKTAFTITMLLIFLTTTLLVFVACSDNAVNDKINSEIVSEEMLKKIAQYYPSEVNFQFIGQEKITDESNQDGFVGQECFLFDVIYENKKKSGVAVGIEDSSIWFLDMDSENLWLSENFMGLHENTDKTIIKSGPIIELLNYERNKDIIDLYFARLNTVPEFSNHNEGSVQWNEKEKTLRISAVKGTGSVTGAVDGPLVDAVITWKNGIPELVSVDYEPAPIFSHPEQVIFSGDVMDIEEDRLIEIAEYFKDLIDKQLNEVENR
ncbi:hypothetical protein MASR2M70_17160 [Bacillota bacterium]